MGVAVASSSAMLRGLEKFLGHSLLPQSSSWASDDGQGELEESEELQMDEICRSSLYCQVCCAWELFMKLSSSGLTSGQEPNWREREHDECKTQIEDTLVADLIPTVPRRFGGNKFGAWLWGQFHGGHLSTLRLVSLQLLCLNLNLRAGLLYAQDKAIKSLLRTDTVVAYLKVLPFGQVKCAPEQQVHHQDPQLFRRLREARHLLQALGTTMMGLPGIGVTTLSIVGILPYAFWHFSQLMLRIRPLQVPHMAFLYQPQLVRRRMERQSRDIIRQLMESLRNRCQASRSRASRGHARGQAGIGGDSRPKTGAGRLQDLKFLQLLVEVHKGRLVRPVCVSSLWLKAMLRLLKFMMIFSMVAAFLFPSWCLLVITLHEIFVRSKRRLERIECRRWQPGGGIPLDDDLVHLPELLGEQERRAYLEHDGSLADLIRLASTIELRYFFTPLACCFILSYCLVLLYISFLSTFFVNVFIFATLDKLVWMEQLKSQIQLCSLSSQGLGLERLEPGSSPKHLGPLEEQLVKRLTVAYLNYELFRRNHRTYRPLAHFYIVQALLVAAAGFLVFYLVGTSVRTKAVSLMLVTMCAIAGVINIYLTGSSLVAKRMEQIMGDIMRLVAHLTSASFGRCYAVELWRRQCLGDQETRRFYATSLFGIYISYEKLLSFNLYAFGVFLLILKININ